MSYRIVFLTALYAIALTIGAIVMTGRAGLAPFTPAAEERHTLRIEPGAPFLLCSGYGFACNGSTPFYQITQPTTPCSFGGCALAYAPFDLYPYIRQPVYDPAIDAYRLQPSYSPSYLLCPGDCVRPWQTLSVAPQGDTDPFYTYLPATLVQPPFTFPGPTLNVAIVTYQAGLIAANASQPGYTWSSDGY
jgi:hypothetical protein